MQIIVARPYLLPESPIGAGLLRARLPTAPVIGRWAVTRPRSKLAQRRVRAAAPTPRAAAPISRQETFSTTPSLAQALMELAKAPPRADVEEVQGALARPILPNRGGRGCRARGGRCWACPVGFFCAAACQA